jgi:hypothetical protein
LRDGSDDTTVRRPKASSWVFDGKQKITMSLAGIALLAAGAIAVHSFVATHASTYFVRSASAQLASDGVARQIREVGDAAKSAAQAAQQAVAELHAHVDGERIAAARARIDVLRGEISNTQLWESANGANDISRARRRDLESQLARTIAYVECLEDRGAFCQP